jgi:Fe2+ or Zn2+ uptake regulation protein
LVPSNYYRPLTKTQLKLHKEILRLHDKGLSYRKIHKELINNGFKIGKSPSTVHSIIKKREKRDNFLNKTVVEGYTDFDILFYKVTGD